MIDGPQSDGYPIVNYEYAIVSTKQPNALAAQAVKAVLAWAIDPTRRVRVDLPHAGRLRGAAPGGGVDLDQAHRPRFVSSGRAGTESRAPCPGRGATSRRTTRTPRTG